MSANKELWQIMVDGQIYESDFDGLKEWVAEGCFHLEDKVKKGSLNWIEAGKVPMLRRLFVGAGAIPVVGTAPAESVNAFGGTGFSGNASGSFSSPSAPISPAPTALGQPAGYGAQQPPAQPPINQFHNPAIQNGGREFVAPRPPVPASHRPVASCYYHPDLQPKYMCKSCANTFCDNCVKFVNGRIPLCHLCGELCDTFEKVKQRAMRDNFRRSGFGFEDFGTALVYPFKHPVSLFVGAALYALLLIAGLFGNIAAYMMLFGCMTLTIRQVAWGRVDRCFMPEDDFSFWDDMIHPAILGIGITIVSWGPTIVLAVILIFTVMSGMKSAGGPEVEVERAVSSQPNGQDFADLDSNDPVVRDRAARKIEASQQPGGTARAVDEAAQRQSQQVASRVLATSLPILGLMVLTIIWGFLYYPMALTVAGYTQIFGSVINPLVGLDTMKRMGFTYVKAFLMYFAVFLVGSVITVGIWIITAPFDMPIVGNLPGKVMNGVVTFYTSLVIACILGLSLYKSSDKLDILTD